MSTEIEELIKRARFLRNSSPQAFDEFHKAFAAYATRQLNNLISATDNLSLAQGHSQQCQKITMILDEARKNG